MSDTAATPDNRPLVSVIMPCRNASQTISDSIQSVQAQSKKSWELIVADDGSTDGSQDIVLYLARDDPRIKLLRHEGASSGASAARNRSLALAQGRYIAFLDADDLWLSEKLDTHIGEMQTHSSAFSCSSYWVRRQGKPDVLRQPPLVITRQTLLKGNRIGCLTAVYDSDLLGKQPMPDIPRRHDYALWLHLLTLTDSAIGIPAPLAIHWRHAKSLSSDPVKSSIATWFMLRNEAGLGRLQATRTLACHLFGRIYRG